MSHQLVVSISIHTWNSPENKKRRSPSIKSECLSHVTRSVNPLLLSSRFSKLTRGAAAVTTAIMAIDTLVNTPRATIESTEEAMWERKEPRYAFFYKKGHRNIRRNPPWEKSWTWFVFFSLSHACCNLFYVAVAQPSDCGWRNCIMKPILLCLVIAI